MPLFARYRPWLLLNLCPPTRTEYISFSLTLATFPFQFYLRIFLSNAQHTVRTRKPVDPNGLHPHRLARRLAAVTSCFVWQPSHLFRFMTQINSGDRRVVLLVNVCVPCVDPLVMSSPSIITWHRTVSNNKSPSCARVPRPVRRFPLQSPWSLCPCTVALKSWL